MVHFTPSEVIAMAEFYYAWRLTDERWDRLPDGVLERIHPLSPGMRGKQMWEQDQLFRYPRALVNGNRYHATELCCLEDGYDGTDNHVKAWLQALPIEPCEEIYISWSNLEAVVTDWATFVEYWDSFWYPFNVLNVYDDTHAWGVLFGPEEFAAYVQPGATTPESSNWDFEAGIDLIRTYPERAVRPEESGK